MVPMARAVLYLSLCLCVCQVRGSHTTSKMNKTIQSLLVHYNISERERFTGTPVFPRQPAPGRTEINRVFFGAVLETYEKLIEHMLKKLQPDTPPALPGSASNGGVDSSEEVRTKLNFILKRIQDLKTNRYKEQSQLLQDLSRLTDIQMDNLTTQSKALGELPRLYQAASELTNHIKTQRRRRRRQVWKNKPRPSARGGETPQ